jgi:hypothetical protein
MPMERTGSGEVLSKSEFHAQLRAWLAGMEEKFVGDISENSQAVWIHIFDGSYRFGLNADTSRQAVADYLKIVDQCGDDLAWTAIENEPNEMKAVAYGPGPAVRLPMFNLFLTKAD